MLLRGPGRPANASLCARARASDAKDDSMRRAAISFGFAAWWYGGDGVPDTTLLYLCGLHKIEITPWRTA
ncbi:unnamed protein product [Gadus morhua 'NCC']